MKTYQKPIMIALSLTGNEQLCGSCATRGASVLLVNDTALADQLTTFFGFGDNDGITERSDFATVFGSATEGCADIFKDYCKFTHSESNPIIAWS